MTTQVELLPADVFAGVWNKSGSLEEAATKVKEMVGGRAPRWAVLARATAMRKAGADLKRFPIGDK
ncbi:hypothetical protein [Urbifossiella limnaea]|uniref:Uncharacterized protein n=1 Tax=Urbifossiella limnaea TaxID=2528023 RepID=A0A517XZE3_9BACT|nr:hypothetical protein [Urbifossiella limnaea]QDU22879.1 hypothetical protein ETAA1_48680 [Urbifossiella limnaea]